MRHFEILPGTKEYDVVFNGFDKDESFINKDFKKHGVNTDVISQYYRMFGRYFISLKPDITNEQMDTFQLYNSLKEVSESYFLMLQHFFTGQRADRGGFKVPGKYAKTNDNERLKKVLTLACNWAIAHQEHQTAAKIEKYDSILGKRR